MGGTSGLRGREVEEESKGCGDGYLFALLYDIFLLLLARVQYKDYLKDMKGLVADLRFRVLQYESSQELPNAITHISSLYYHHLCRKNR